MVDLETLSTSPTASILSIGAVVFGDAHLSKAPEGYTREFYQNVDDPTGTIDSDTVMWWLKQSKEAQERLLKLRAPLDEALYRFVHWCSMHQTGSVTGLYSPGERPNVEFWSRSPSFDEVILQSAYVRANVFSPLNFRQSRDCRTIEALAGFPFKPTEGLAHDSLSDAREQAKHVTACLAKFGFSS